MAGTNAAANSATKHPMRRLFSSRRGLVAGAAALVGAGLAKLTRPDTAQAGVDGDVILGATNGYTGAATIVSNGSLTNIGFAGYNRVIGVEGVGQSHGTGIRGSSNAGNGPDFGGGGPGVEGRSGTGSGVYGESTSGVGVGGVSASWFGVSGTSSNHIGVYGASTNYHGVFGVASSGNGVFGTSTRANGVRGESSTGVGVFGQSTSSHGCGGTTAKSGNAGLFGLTGVNGAVAMLGVHTLAGGTAAFFQGTVTVVGGLQVIGGPKNALVPHPDGSHRRMYSMEAPEAWFEDFGTAQLANGKAVVDLDPDFDALVRGDDYLVFPVAEGDCNGLFISRKGPHRFVVEELKGGKSTLTFSYRVVSRRKEDVGKRMEKVQLPAIDIEKLKRDVQASTATTPAPSPAKER